jgi:hypothetical protein
MSLITKKINDLRDDVQVNKQEITDLRISDNNFIIRRSAANFTSEIISGLQSFKLSAIFLQTLYILSKRSIVNGVVHEVGINGGELSRSHNVWFLLFQLMLFFYFSSVFNFRYSFVLPAITQN